MLRWFAKITIPLFPSLILLINLMSLVGQARGGEIMAYVTHVPMSNSGTIDLMDIATHISLKIAESNLYISNIAANRDGWLAFGICGRDECDMFVWDQHTLHRVSDTDNVYDRSLAWSADGRLAWSRCSPTFCDILLWNGISITDITQSPSIVEDHLTWSTDGRLAFQACELTSCDIWVWDGTTSLNITNTSHIDRMSSWSADGRLAFESCVMLCDIWLWDDASVRNLTDTPLVGETLPLWMPNAELMFAVCASYGDCQLLLWDGTASHPIPDAPHDVQYEAISTNGSHLVLQGCNIYCDLWLWDGSRFSRITDTPLINEVFPVLLP